MDSASEWKAKIDGINVWKKENQRAVHKPLLTLMLIASAAQQHGELFSYKEIEDKLQHYLDQFGPSKKTYPHYPFWYLTNDGFWLIENKDELSKQFTSPSGKLFRDLDIRATVPVALWSELTCNQALRIELQEKLLSSYWPDTLHQDIRDAIGLESTDSMFTSQKKRDPNFRSEVMRAYQRTCAICSYDARLSDALFGLEAAHIKWHAYNGPDQVDNGLALCSFHHKAFDKGAIGLNDQLRVIVSSELSGTAMLDSLVYNFENQPIRMPQAGFAKPNEKYIEWHYTNVFKQPERVS